MAGSSDWGKFAAALAKDDVVVVEATGNAAVVAAIIGPHVERVVIANPKQVRIIAHAKIKTDTIDAGVLAQLYASGFLPEVWIADEVTQALRRQVTRRNQIVRQRSRLKNIIQSILHAHLIPSCPHRDLCGRKGRAWLAEQRVPEDERLAIERHLREFDRLGEDLKVVERDLARSALADESIKLLMTIPGIHMIVALAIKAAIGDVKRFARPQKLASYLGLNPSVRQSGPGPTYHGRITKQGRGHARGMLVEAAWAAARTPGPLRAFFLRVRARRGQHGSCRDGAQAGHPGLASADEERELSLGASSATCQEAARSRAQGRAQTGARPEGCGPCLQYQELSRAGAALGRAGRGGLRSLRRRLEPSRA
jgi:transposase